MDESDRTRRTATDEEAPLPEELRSERTQLSEKLDRLRSATLKAISRRERLPQPLFWSLFHAEVNEVKERRKKRREQLAALYGVDWL